LHRFLALLTLPLSPMSTHLPYTTLFRSLVTLGGAVGFNSAMMNPFTVGIAQGIAELPLFSGIGLRFIIWLVLLAVSIYYVMRYADRKSTRLNSSHVKISYAVFCLKKKTK